MCNFYKLVSQIILQGFGTGGMTKLSECLSLDLSDTLTCDIELLSYLLKGAGSAVLKSKSELDNLLFSGGEGVKNIAKLLAK